MTKVFFRISVGIILFCLLALSSACGRKTLPVPPQDATPEVIRDLRFYQDENKIVLNWTYPRQTTIGSDLPQIASFIVFRAVVPAEDYCAGCPISFTTSVELKAEQAIKDKKNRVGQYTEALLRPGHRYLYKVRTKAGWRLISDDSNIISFAWESPAAAPSGLTAGAADMAADLSWQPVVSLLNGEPVAGALYQVYRSRSADSYTPVGEPVVGLNYRDLGLVNGRIYHYKVRAVQIKDESRIIGLASRTVSVVPKDMTAPAPPRNVTVVRLKDGVKVLWERGAEKDIAGYKIYRRTAEQEMAVVGQVGAGKFFFIDHQDPGEQEWSYAVSAYDLAKPANESSLSEERQK